MIAESSKGIWWCWDCDTEMSEEKYINHKKDECKNNQIKAARVKEYKQRKRMVKLNGVEFEHLNSINEGVLVSYDYHCIPPRVFIKKGNRFDFTDIDKAKKEDIIYCYYCDKPAVRISHYTIEGNKTTCYDHLAQRHIDYIETGKI